MQHLTIAPTDPLFEMGRLRTYIGMEAISMSGIANALHNVFPSMKDCFAKYAANFSTSEAPLVLKSNERDFVTLISHHQYLNLASLGAFVPEGLIVPYADYLIILSEAVEHCQSTTLKTLNEFSVMISQVITNRTTKASMPSHTSQNKKAEQVLSNLNKRLGDCFGKGLTRTDVSYGDVVNRNNDWKEVFPAMNIAMATISNIPRTQLHKKAEECNVLLEAIIRQIKAGEFQEAGPEVINNLVGGAYQAALELEFFTVTYYKTASLVTSVGDTMKHVTTALGK